MPAMAPEFHPWDPQKSGRRESAPQGCSMTPVLTGAPLVKNRQTDRQTEYDLKK